ncbi:MAG: hypothetical protein ACKVWR_02710, partial [Acidimicrobiales bacterium]
LAAAAGAAVVLAVAGASLGAVLGWASTVFFTASLAVIAWQARRAAPIVRLDGDGVWLRRGRRDPPRLVRWEQVEGVILWTRREPAGATVDLLSVVPAELAAGPHGAAPEQLLETSVPLVDCRLAAGELKAAMVAFGSFAHLVDRRS